MPWYTEPAFYTGIAAVLTALGTLIAQIRTHTTIKDTNAKVAAIEPLAEARKVEIVTEVKNGHTEQQAALAAATNGAPAPPVA